jgi:hypothetical protein
MAEREEEFDDLVPPPSSRAVRNLLQFKETGQPITLTISGGITLPVRDEASFERLLTLVEWLDTVGLLRERLENAGKRPGLSLEELEARLKEKQDVSH